MAGPVELGEPEAESPLIDDDSAVTKSQRKSKTNKVAFGLLAPSVLVLVLALGYPLYWLVTNSFREYGRAQSIGGAPAPWVGFDNYIQILNEGVNGLTLWTVLIRSISFCLVTAFVTVIIGMLLALLMRAVNTPARIAMQVALLLAWSMPVVAAMRVWMWLFEPGRGGIINHIFVEMSTWNIFGWHPFGAFSEMTGHNWFFPTGVSPLTAQLSFYAVASVIVIWASVPFVAFSLYAGLLQISEEVLEAAEIDGANGWKRFWGIIFPMMAPILNIVILLQIIWDLRVFAQINILQGQIPGKIQETHLLGTYIYQIGIGGGRFGLAAAASIIVLLVTVVISYPYVRKLMKEDN